MGQGNPSISSRTMAWIRIRLNRNPIVGDKFTSRAGQKGILSKLWPDIDMPFCVRSGIRPDLAINPNAFPSRMTIGMLIEIFVSKLGALQGKFVNASPFQNSDYDYNLQESVGKFLEMYGFQKYGGEIMISGVSGVELPVNIYVGNVYYQRLRHMVSDKCQVRSTGPIDRLTHQPVKGRKFGGGIRIGEMERDSLLAHGAAFLVQDRLYTSSDYYTTDCCKRCGLLNSMNGKNYMNTNLNQKFSS